MFTSNIATFSLSLGERAGVRGNGYAASLGTTLYFAFWAEFIAKHLLQWGHSLAHFLHLGS